MVQIELTRNDCFSRLCLLIAGPSSTSQIMPQQHLSKLETLSLTESGTQLTKGRTLCKRAPYERTEIM
jgi:hypothetical protein